MSFNPDYTYTRHMPHGAVSTDPYARHMPHGTQAPALLAHKTYSLARKIFQGMGMIIANIVTIGLVNTIPSFRNEYKFVFLNYSYPTISHDYIAENEAHLLSFGLRLNQGIDLTAPLWTRIYVGTHGIIAESLATGVRINSSGLTIHAFGLSILHLGTNTR